MIRALAPEGQTCEPLFVRARRGAAGQGDAREAEEATDDSNTEMGITLPPRSPPLHKQRDIVAGRPDLGYTDADKGWADGYPAIRYSSSSRRPTIIFWISAVPSPISSIGASRYRRSISYSLEKP